MFNRDLDGTAGTDARPDQVQGCMDMPHGFIRGHSYGCVFPKTCTSCTIASLYLPCSGYWTIYHFSPRNVYVECRQAGSRYSAAQVQLLVDDSCPLTMEELYAMGNKLLAKASKGTAGSRGKQTGLSAKFSKEYPYLAAFLSEDTDAEDKPRDRSKLTIFDDGGAVKATLSDPSQECSLYVTVREPGEAFAAVEKALQVDDPDWRQWPKSSKKKFGKGA